MALRNLSTEQMIGLSQQLLDPKQGRPLLEGHRKASVFVEDLDDAHQSLVQVTSPAPGREIDQQLAAISAREVDFDLTHDRKLRGGFALLGALAELSDDEDERVALLELRDTLVPAGLTTIGLSYLDEAGNAARVRAMLKQRPELRARLKDVPLTGGRNLDTAVGAWLTAGEQLGKLEAQKAELLARRDQQPTAASPFEARNAWVQAVHAIESALTVRKGQPDPRLEEVFFRPLREAQTRADRKASARTTAPAPDSTTPAKPAGG